MVNSKAWLSYLLLYITEDTASPKSPLVLFKFILYQQQKPRKHRTRVLFRVYVQLLLSLLSLDDIDVMWRRAYENNVLYLESCNSTFSEQGPKCTRKTFYITYKYLWIFKHVKACSQLCDQMIRSGTPFTIRSCKGPIQFDILIAIKYLSSIMCEHHNQSNINHHTLCKK